MADPFSIIAGSASLVDLAIKVVKFINETKKGTDTIDEDLRQLVADIRELSHVSELIGTAFEADLQVSLTALNMVVNSFLAVDLVLNVLQYRDSPVTIWQLSVDCWAFRTDVGLGDQIGTADSFARAYCGQYDAQAL